MNDSPLSLKRANRRNVTGFSKKSLFSSFFTIKPFCRRADRRGTAAAFLFNMPKFENPCNIRAVHVMYCIGAVKKKIAGVAV